MRSEPRKTSLNSNPPAPGRPAQAPSSSARRTLLDYGGLDRRAVLTAEFLGNLEYGSKAPSDPFGPPAAAEIQVGPESAPLGVVQRTDPISNAIGPWPELETIPSDGSIGIDDDGIGDDQPGGPPSSDADGLPTSDPGESLSDGDDHTEERDGEANSGTDTPQDPEAQWTDPLWGTAGELFESHDEWLAWIDQVLGFGLSIQGTLSAGWLGGVDIAANGTMGPDDSSPASTPPWPARATGSIPTENASQPARPVGRESPTWPAWNGDPMRGDLEPVLEPLVLRMSVESAPHKPAPVVERAAARANYFDESDWELAKQPGAAGRSASTADHNALDSYQAFVLIADVEAAPLAIHTPPNDSAGSDELSISRDHDVRVAIELAPVDGRERDRLSLALEANRLPNWNQVSWNPERQIIHPGKGFGDEGHFPWVDSQWRAEPDLPPLTLTVDEWGIVVTLAGYGVVCGFGRESGAKPQRRSAAYALLDPGVTRVGRRWGEIGIFRTFTGLFRTIAARFCPRN